MGMVLTSFIHKFHNGNPCDKIKAYTYMYILLSLGILFMRIPWPCFLVYYIKQNSNVRDTWEIFQLRYFVENALSTL